MRPWLTTGTFDTPHFGHARLLARIRHYTQNLVVGVLSDEFVASYKGEAPIFSAADRVSQVAMLGRELFPQFRAVIISDQAKFIRQERPSMIVVGSDWHGGERYLNQLGITQDELDSMQIGVCYLPYTPNISTREIKQRAHGHHR